MISVEEAQLVLKAMEYEEKSFDAFIDWLKEEHRAFPNADFSAVVATYVEMSFMQAMTKYLKGVIHPSERVRCLKEIMNRIYHDLHKEIEGHENAQTQNYH